MRRPIAVVGAPSSIGIRPYDDGQARYVNWAPGVLRERGIITRLGQLLFAIREAGWDRNRQGAALSELANETTWLLVTLAWLVG